MPEGPVVLAEGAMEIRILKRQGLSVREIARCTGYSRNTVERHLSRKCNPVYTARSVVPIALALQRPPPDGALMIVSRGANVNGG